MPLPNRRSSRSSRSRRASRGSDRVPPPTVTGATKKVVLVDQTCLDRLGRELGAANAHVTRRSDFHPSDGLDVELRLDSCSVG